jgi:hypothetical protein
MNTGLSLVSEILERRDRLKAQHSDALLKRQAAMQADNWSDQAYYKGLEEGLDRALIHLDWLVDLAKQGGK